MPVEGLWDEPKGTREKVVPFSAAGHHYSGFMAVHMEKAARAYMFAGAEGFSTAILTYSPVPV